MFSAVPLFPRKYTGNYESHHGRQSNLLDDLSAEKNRFSKILNEQIFRINGVFSGIFGVNATTVIDGLHFGKSIEAILNEINFNVPKKDSSEIPAAIAF